MFGTTTDDATATQLRVSFLTCVKAGIGFTLGAAAVSAIGMLLWFTVLLPMWYRVLLASLRH